MADALGGIDAVIHTGDLAEDGHPDEYARFREIVADLDAPLFALPGNHDERDAMRNAGLAPEQAADDGPICAAVDIGPVRALLLDTVTPGASRGAIDERQLVWAEAEIDAAARDGRPALLFGHHPPFESGVGYMDAIRLLDGAADLIALFARPNVRLYACGHHHRLIMTVINGAPVVAAPASAGQLALDFRAKATPHLAPEQSAVLVHVWRPTAEPFAPVSTYLSAF